MLAPGDQFRTLIARASVPAVMPGLSHDDVPCPPREHGRIRRLGPQPECGSAATLTVLLVHTGSWRVDSEQLRRVNGVSTIVIARGGKPACTNSPENSGLANPSLG